MFGQPIVLEFHVHFLILLALLRVLAQHLLVGSAGVVLVAAEIGTSSWDRCLRGHGCVGPLFIRHLCKSVQDAIPRLFLGALVAEGVDLAAKGAD